MQRNRIQGFWLIIIAITLVSLSCGLTNTTSIQPDWTRTPTAFQPLLSTPQSSDVVMEWQTSTTPPPTPVSTQIPTLESYEISIDERLPDSLVNSLQNFFDDNIASAPLSLSYDIGISEENHIAEWVYCAVVPFPTISSATTFNDLNKIWLGRKPDGLEWSKIYLSPDTAAALVAWWGIPDSNAIEILAPGELLSTNWNDPEGLTILPFEELEPHWKVLEVNGQNPIHNNFDSNSYVLTLKAGPTSNSEAFRQTYSDLPAFTNRSPEKLTNLMITGVTALVRATAHDMETNGITYPAGDLGDLLASADITHISNEIPFAENCPFPDPWQVGVRFCSDPRYMELLEVVGTDIIELTGDHFADWGTEAMLLTLEMYAEKGWPVYGGGENADEAKQAVLLEHNGNKIAFIGCNGKGPPFSQASETNPGSVTCDYEFIESEIARLAEEGYLTIVTYQHHEYYSYACPEVMAKEFDRMAEAGAVIVSGSQAHHPHELTIINGGFVHYGLGNMFFDQYSVGVETRQSFIDRHVFYNGQYISTELIPIQFIDFSRPRLMTDPEARALLWEIFSISEWEVP